MPVTSSVPGFIGCAYFLKMAALRMASPDLEIRATITTVPSQIAFSTAWGWFEPSSRHVKGCLAWWPVRSTRAWADRSFPGQNTKSVSVGDPFPQDWAQS